MPTTGTVLAKNMAMYIGGTIVTCQTNASISMQTNMFEATCKDSGADSEKFPGVKSWTASGEGLFAMDAANGFPDIFAAWKNQTQIAIIFQTGVTGDLKYVGNAYVSNAELTSNGNDEAVTFSYELTGTGAMTEETVS